MNGAAATTLSDDSSHTNTGTLPANPVVSIVAENEQLFVEGTGSITMLGVAYPP